MGGIAPAPIGDQEVERGRRNESSGAIIEQAMRGGENLVARDHHTAAIAARSVEQLADRGPGIASLIDRFAIPFRWTDGGAVCSGQHREADRCKKQQPA
jgi:hypothetical protein